MSVFHAEVYKAAALEHIVVAGDLYNEARYVLCCYVAGLSVECLMRAYRVLIDPEFDSKHDLKLLSKACRWFERIPRDSGMEANEALDNLWTRWENAHRFRSAHEYRRFLRRAGLHRGIRGDFVKEQTRRALRAAELLVRIGATSWPHE